MSRIRFSFLASLLATIAWALWVHPSPSHAALAFPFVWCATLGGITLVEALRRLTRSH